MRVPTMNELLGKVPNRYMLVNVAAQRARKIAQDADEQQLSLDEKPVTTALIELVMGDIEVELLPPYEADE